MSGEDDPYTMSDALNRLRLAAGYDTEQDMLSMTDVLAISDLYDIVDLSASGPCSLARKPGKNNWVEEGGGLPNYICHIAKSLHQKRGFPVSQAIAIAVGRTKKWAAGGGDVDPDTRAKAAKAVAEWEALKAKAHTKSAAKSIG